MRLSLSVLGYNLIDLEITRRPDRPEPPYVDSRQPPIVERDPVVFEPDEDAFGFKGAQWQAGGQAPTGSPGSRPTGPHDARSS